MLNTNLRDEQFFQSTNLHKNQKCAKTPETIRVCYTLAAETRMLFFSLQ